MMCWKIRLNCLLYSYIVVYVFKFTKGFEITKFTNNGVSFIRHPFYLQSDETPKENDSLTLTCFRCSTVEGVLQQVLMDVIKFFNRQFRFFKLIIFMNFFKFFHIICKIRIPFSRRITGRYNTIFFVTHLVTIFPEFSSSIPRIGRKKWCYKYNKH